MILMRKEERRKERSISYRAVMQVINLGDLDSHSTRRDLKNWSLVFQWMSKN
jgi:hypothetical protein